MLSRDDHKHIRFFFIVHHFSENDGKLSKIPLSRQSLHAHMNIKWRRSSVIKNRFEKDYISQMRDI